MASSASSDLRGGWPGPVASARSPVRILTAAQLVSAVGDGCFYVVFAVHLSRNIGLGAPEIGMLLSVAWGSGFLATHPIGVAADRLGLRRAAVVLALTTAAGLLLLMVARPGWSVALGCLVYALSQSGAAGVRQGLLVQLVPDAQIVAVRAGIQRAVNLGIGLGAVLGGVGLLAPGALPALLLLDATLFFGSGLLLSRLPMSGPAPSPVRSRRGALGDRRYLTTAALTAVLYLYMPLLSVILPLYLTARTPAPPWMVAAVFVVNAGGVVLAQHRAARGIVTVRDSVRALRQAGCLLLVCCLLFWGAGSTATAGQASVVVLVASLVQTAGEVRLAAGSWGLGFGLADPSRPGEWQAVFASGIPLARALGPALLAPLLLTWRGPGWLVLGVVFAVVPLLLTVVVTPRGGRRGRGPRPRDSGRARRALCSPT